MYNYMCFLNNSSTVACRNAMLTDDAVVVLIDYGKAKEMHEGADGTTYYKQRGDVAIPIRWYE